ncbi:hypothetical protein E2C01_097268 [Portunus trituberculatus]|uniref:Uncharacterized protein n=2 Tax=Portunus trituberculatus TaxID=210409 RepID=A0A5B7K942_PORTR|nr:hypothetical protein [Portunus trituberculatus]
MSKCLLTLAIKRISNTHWRSGVPYRARPLNNNNSWRSEVPYAAMSSKVQPREHTQPPMTKIESRVGPETKFFVNAKGKQIHCSYWRPNDCAKIR